MTFNGTELPELFEGGLQVVEHQHNAEGQDRALLCSWDGEDFKITAVTDWGTEEIRPVSRF